MRSRNAMPTVLEYVQLFAPTMKESVKQLTKCGFHYFTASSSFYELPEKGSLHFTDIPMIPQLPTKNMSIAGQKVLHDWHDNYGQPVVQVTVRNQTTKDNVGTLLLYSYTKPQPTPQPLSFSISRDISAPTQRSLCFNADVLFSSGTVLAIKPSIAGITGRSMISTPFYLGVASDDIYQDQHVEHLLKINIYLPSEQNIFLFEIAHQIDTPKEAVGLALDSLEVTSTEALLLTDEVYEGVVNAFREARDLCIEGDDNGVDLVTEEADCLVNDINNVVCADSIMLSTTCNSQGRSICPPTRLDL